MMEVVTGGSGSGKSAYAEDRICRLYEQEGRRGALYYIAAMYPEGRETKQKIERHRQMRAGKGFETKEWHMDLKGRLMEDTEFQEGSCVLAECMSNLMANEMYMDGGAGEETVNAVLEGIRCLRKRCSHLVVVTNEVFSESVPDSEEMKKYKKFLGEINRRLAQEADRLTEVVFGIPCRYKEKEREIVREEKENGRMRMITGGAFQGKRAWAEKQIPGVRWTDGAECGFEEIIHCEGMDHFHTFIRRWIQAGRDGEELIREIEDNNPEFIFITDEIGCGLVPIDAFERKYREAAGRICTRLAESCHRVDRILCGTAVRIK